MGHSQGMNGKHPPRHVWEVPEYYWDLLVVSSHYQNTAGKRVYMRCALFSEPPQIYPKDISRVGVAELPGTTMAKHIKKSKRRSRFLLA